MSNLKKLFLSGNYIVLNKTLIKKIGIETSFLFSVLIEGEEIIKNENPDFNGWFFQTVEKLEKITGLSKHKQNECLKRLEKQQFIEVKYLGIPKKRYIKINEDALILFILNDDEEKSFKSPNNSHSSKNSPTSGQKILPQEDKKFDDIINNINIKNIDKNINYKNNIVEQIAKENIGNELKEKLIELVEYRNSIKKPYKTYISIKKLINSIGKDYIDEQHLIESIESSIINQYLGVFPKKINKELKPINARKETLAERLLRELKEGKEIEI